MALQAIGKNVGNALVPKFENTRLFSGATITIGVALAALGIVSLAFASSGVLPMLPIQLFKSGWTLATAMKYSIILTAVGGGVMAAPCIINLIATGVKKIKERSNAHQFPHRVDDRNGASSKSGSEPETNSASESSTSGWSDSESE